MPSQLTAPSGADEFGETCNVDVLHDLVRVEVAAVESYDRLIGRSADSPATATLQRIREDHSEAVSVLRERIRHFGGEPEYHSGTWQAQGVPGWSVEREARLEGLREGEETGIGQYESALIDPAIDTDCKDLIRYRLLPRCQSNVRELGRMQAADRA